MVRSGQITIIQMNDTHGYLYTHPEMFWQGSQAEYRPAGGYARIAAVIRQARRERPGQVLALDCGDTIHGTYEAVHSKGESFVPILNAIGFDGMTGHWEFAYGPAQLKKIAAGLNYPMLAANCYDDETGEHVFEPYTVREAGGLRVGIIGLAATIVDKTMPPYFSEGIHFTLGKDELPGLITNLREGEQVDLVVLISHLGFPQDMQLASEVQGIDVLLSAHTHNRIACAPQVNGTIIIQSGAHGSFLGRLDIDVQNGRVAGFEHQLMVIDESITPDAEVQRMVDEVMQPYRSSLDVTIGQTLAALNRGRVLECTMDNFLLRALLDVTGSPIAFSNGWRYGAPIPAGPITLRDLWNIIPVNPPVSTVEMTGEEIVMMLEENLEHTFSRNPYQQMGGYLKRSLGLNMYFKVENSAGHRICELYVGDELIQPGMVYPVTYVTAQGVPGKYGSNHQKLGVTAIDALLRYLEKHPVVEAELPDAVVMV